MIWTGVAASGDGRIFVTFPRSGGAANPSLAVLDGSGVQTPFPGGTWNDWKPGADPTHGFVSVGALRTGPDGMLWVVDSGVAADGRSPVPNAAKVVRIDPASGAVTRVYPLAAVLKPRSLIDQIAFNGGRAYLADGGAPALIVLDLASGEARRVLEKDRSATALRPALVNGKILRGEDGKPASINVDALDVAPDGKTLFFQPMPGPMYRVGTKLLDDPTVPAVALSAQVEFWYNTPSLGGMAIDPGGNLFMFDLGSNAVLKLTPDRRLSLVIRDDRLHWVSAPSFDAHGDLLLPVAELDRSAPFNHGHDQIHWPLPLFRLHVGAHG